MKLSDPLSLTEARRITVRLYVEMTRRGWRHDDYPWTSRQAGRIAKLVTDLWDDPETTDEGRWNIFHNYMAAFYLTSIERQKKMRMPQKHEDYLDV